MLNMQALEALAALCGSAAAAAAAPTANLGSVAVSPASSSPNAHQQQPIRAAAAPSANQSANQWQQTQVQAPGARPQPLAALPPHILQAYLASAAPGAAPASHLAALAGALGNQRRHDPNPDAQATPANYILARQQLQQQQLQGPQQQPQVAEHLLRPQQQPQPAQQQHHYQPRIALNTPPALAMPLLSTSAATAATAVPAMQQLQSTPSPSLQVTHSPAMAASAEHKEGPKAELRSQAKPPPKKRQVASKQEEGPENVNVKSVMNDWEDKKEAKRAANRLSAHLSRKRKKMFIEDLKEENEDLRRKELILRSIPDLIVVFDSSGRMPFVSHSVSQFLDYTPDELRDTSFWDRLTEESVRSIKSAFMDALAVKRPKEGDSTPLWGGGTMAVTLVDRDGDVDAGKTAFMKGVVHFSGDSPECVCSIRHGEVDSGMGAVQSGDGKQRKVGAESACSLSSSPRASSAGRVAVHCHAISDIDSERGNLF